MPAHDPADRKLSAQQAANSRWSKVPDRLAETAPGRRAAFERFEREVDPDGTLSPAERRKRAENARRAHMQRLALKSLQVRRRKAQQAKAAQTRDDAPQGVIPTDTDAPVATNDRARRGRS